MSDVKIKVTADIGDASKSMEKCQRELAKISANVDKAQKKSTQVGAKMKASFEQAKGAVTPLTNSIEQMSTGLGEASQGAVSVISAFQKGAGVFAIVAGAIQGIVYFFNVMREKSQAFNDDFEAGLAGIQGYIEGITLHLGEMANALGNSVGSRISATWEAWKEGVQAFKNDGFGAAVDAIRAKWNELHGAIEEADEALKNATENAKKQAEAMKQANEAYTRANDAMGTYAIEWGIQQANITEEIKRYEAILADTQADERVRAEAMQKMTAITQQLARAQAKLNDGYKTQQEAWWKKLIVSITTLNDEEKQALMTTENLRKAFAMLSEVGGNDKMASLGGMWAKLADALSDGKFGELSKLLMDFKSTMTAIDDLAKSATTVNNNAIKGLQDSADQLKKASAVASAKKDYLSDIEYNLPDMRLYQGIATALKDEANSIIQAFSDITALFHKYLAESGQEFKRELDTDNNTIKYKPAGPQIRTERLLSNIDAKDVPVGLIRGYVKEYEELLNKAKKNPVVAEAVDIKLLEDAVNKAKELVSTLSNSQPSDTPKKLQQLSAMFFDDISEEGMQEQFDQMNALAGQLSSEFQKLNTEGIEGFGAWLVEMNQITESDFASGLWIEKIKDNLSGLLGMWRDMAEAEAEAERQATAQTEMKLARQEAFKDMMLQTGDAITEVTGNMQAQMVISKALAAIETVRATVEAVRTAGSKGDPYTVAIRIAAAAAAVVSAVAAGVNASKKFADGGIVDNRYGQSGDRGMVRVNGGEMILNHTQQANLFHMIKNGAGSNNMQGNVIFKVSGRDLVGVLNQQNRLSGLTKGMYNK